MANDTADPHGDGLDSPNRAACASAAAGLNDAPLNIDAPAARGDDSGDACSSHDGSDQLGTPRSRRGKRRGTGDGDNGRRVTRRRKREAELLEQQNWELQGRLADASAEIEALANEAARLRYLWNVPVSLVPVVELPPREQQRLALEHKRRLAEIVFKQCSAVVKQLQAHKWAFPFNAPVDTNKYQDYLKVVSQPMDLSTIKTKIEGCAYVHPDDCANDIRLVFANAKRYNPAGSDVHVMAHTLLERFEEKWQQAVVPKLGDERISSANEEMGARKRLLEAQQQQVLERLDAKRQALLAQLDELAGRVSDAKSAAAAACTPLSHIEKEALTQALAELPQQHFETAMSIVLSHHPDLLQQGCGETVLNVDHMHALTLRQLQSFINAAANSGARTRAGRRTGGEVNWPGLAVGAGLRAFRPPSARPAAEPTVCAPVPRTHVDGTGASEVGAAAGGKAVGVGTDESSLPATAAGALAPAAVEGASGLLAQNTASLMHEGVEATDGRSDQNGLAPG